MSEQYKKLFQPIKIRDLEIKNRFFMSPMANFGHVDEHGALSDAAVEYYVERAKGGVGLIITGYCITDEHIEEPHTPSIMVIKDDPTLFIQKSSLLTERVHAYGCKIFLQLTAGFGRGAKIVKLNKKIAVSDMVNKHDYSIKHREMKIDEIEYMIKSFGKAASIAKRCGFDGVEIHALHEGYLLDQFTIEYFNKRNDAYGGNFNNRYRVAVEIAKEIKKVCGNNFPISLRYSVKHMMKSLNEGMLPEEADSAKEIGRDTEEGIEAAKYLQYSGYDALNVDVGSFEAHYMCHPNIFTEDGLYLKYAEKVKSISNVPILVSGRVDNPNLALDAISANKCDMIGLGRPMLADPFLVNKIKNGEINRIRNCISCNYGCITNRINNLTVRCAVNPLCYVEKTNNLNPIINKKNVIVVGGGPAGMQAALTSAMRGHNVALYEKSEKLGGNLKAAGDILYKHHIHNLINWFENELNHYNVNINLNSKIDKNVFNTRNIDVLFIATGSKPRSLTITGTSFGNIYYAHEVFRKLEIVGTNVTIIGGGQIGMETAIWLSKMGRKVTVVEFANVIMGGPTNSASGDIEMVKLYIKYYGIKLLLKHEVLEINKNNLLCKDIDNGSVENIYSDSIILAIGYESNNTLYNELKDGVEVKEVYNIGDSNHVANIYYAIHDAYEVANNI